MKGCFPKIMGANASVALMNEEKSLDLSPPDARYFGLHNFGNTCYCNSVLQALFFCLPFREQVLQYRQQRNGKHGGGKKDSLLACLCDLFNCIICQKRKAGVMQPKKFVARLRKENESFDNFMQHDAHEFFNHLLNSIHVVLLEEKKAEKERKRLLEQQNAIGAAVKKERSSFFHKSKKSKSQKANASNTPSKSCPDPSLTFTDNSSSAAPLSEGAASIAFPPSTEGEAVTLLKSSKKASSEPRLANGQVPSGSSPNLHSSPSSKTFSLFSRIRQSKKVSSSTKSSNEINKTRLPTTAEEDEEDTSTWIYDIFQGTYTTITRCLNCETVKNRDEDFLDLSVDIEQNTSITHCLRVFSHQQTLGGEHKYFCEVCQSKQEAEIEMRLKKLPTILVLHLKRFKYCDTLNKYTKLSYRVVFPFELRLFNTTEDASNDHRLYDLIGVVVHCGSGPYRGHYISVVKSHGMWMLFDDDTVERMQPNSMEDFYGVTTDKNSESGYILFYQSRE